jgi:hypothetical protein
VHPDAADALRTQTHGRGEDEIGAVSFEHVDRADVRGESPLNEVNDVGERFGGVAAARHELRHFLVRPQAQELFVRECVGVGDHGRQWSKITAPQRTLESLKNRVVAGSIPTSVLPRFSWTT